MTGLLEKLETARTKIPKIEHCLMIFTNKRVTDNAAGTVLKGKKGVGVVSATDDGLAWALCYTLSYMLVAKGKN